MEDAVAGRLTGRNTKTEAQIPQNVMGGCTREEGTTLCTDRRHVNPQVRTRHRWGQWARQLCFMASCHSTRDAFLYLMKAPRLCLLNVALFWLLLVQYSLRLFEFSYTGSAFGYSSYPIPPPHTHTLGTCVYRALVCMCSLLWCLLLYLVWDSFMDLFCVRRLWSIK